MRHAILRLHAYRSMRGRCGNAEREAQREHCARNLKEPVSHFVLLHLDRLITFCAVYKCYRERLYFLSR